MIANLTALIQKATAALSNSAVGAESITLDQDTSRIARGIYVGGDGDVTLLMADDSTITLIGVVAGNFYPFAFKQVTSSGTTATNLVALL